EYRTLIDSFTKVVSFKLPGPAIEGPTSFRAFTKDGRILTFGATTDSLVRGRNGVHLAWLLNLVEDRAGNTMTIQYTNLPGSIPTALSEGTANVVRPSRIGYTGHASETSNEPGNRTVLFSYQERGDKRISFLQGGMPYSTPVRLSRVTTFVNNLP